MIYIGDQALKDEIRRLKLALRLKRLECEELALINEHLRLSVKANVAAMAQYVPKESESGH